MNGATSAVFILDALNLRSTSDAHVIGRKSNDQSTSCVSCIFTSAGRCGRTHSFPSPNLAALSISADVLFAFEAFDKERDGIDGRVDESLVALIAAGNPANVFIESTAVPHPERRA
jgi:hypothetical protein